MKIILPSATVTAEIDVCLCKSLSLLAQAQWHSNPTDRNTLEMLKTSMKAESVVC